MKHRLKQRGFTLIEVTVAFAIFALSIGALFEVFSDSNRRSIQSRDRNVAWLTAQSVLAQLRVRPAPWQTEQEGQGLAGNVWHLSIEPLDGVSDAQDAWKAYEVTVRVGHGKSSAHDVVLKSIELARTSP